MQYRATLEKQLDLQEETKSFKKKPHEDHKPTLNLVFSKENSSSLFLREESTEPNPLLWDDYTNATHCISLINDPLWKNICVDLLNMMGPASVLKVWKSTLEEFSPQEKSLEIICETEETMAFVQQYDFIILGSLQRYFPALKQLRIKTVPVRSHLHD